MFAHIVEKHEKFWMLLRIRPGINTVQEEQYVIHGTDWSFPDSIGFIRHYALDERSDSFFFVEQSWSHDFCEFIEDFLVTSLDIGVVESWSVNQSHKASRACFDDSSYRFIRLFVIKTTSKLVWLKMLIVEHWNCWQCGRFTLTTFTNCNCSPRHKLYVFQRIMLIFLCLIRYVLLSFLEIIFLFMFFVDI